MKIRSFINFIPVALMLALIMSGCAQQQGATTASQEAKPAVAEKKDPFVLKGPVVGRSNKAKTISITVGSGAAAKTMMVRFDDQTEGIEYAKKGEAAIIRWEQRGEDKFATVIKPKLAKLPEGVTEINVDELYQLLEDQVPMTLVDARPELRYNQGHLPTAVSIPVPKLKEKKAEVLPQDKDKLLVFYCGGYT
ncbi:MAG: rhodanese-like domain-containing protein [Desulfofustis sp.]|nr:rhodanese-like domain-containing protein [Desulfofustis sp.]NNK55955.1 rhodanese-like domain-containing protein [Desulfofustis sp.]